MVLIRNAAFPGPRPGFWTPEPVQPAARAVRPNEHNFVYASPEYRADCLKLLEEIRDYIERKDMAPSAFYLKVGQSTQFATVLRRGTARQKTVERVRDFMRRYP